MKMTCLGMTAVAGAAVLVGIKAVKIKFIFQGTGNLKCSGSCKIVLRFPINAMANGKWEMVNFSGV
jgi:hypothetical protein